MIPYALDNDEAARAFIGREVVTPHAVLWRELTAPDRVAQTIRALQYLANDVQSQLARRRSDLEEIEQEVRAGTMPSDAYTEERELYVGWKARVARYHQTVLTRLRDAKAEQKRHNIEEAERRRNGEDAAFRTVLTALVETIAAHQAAITSDGQEARPADRLLWAHLNLARTPSGDPILALIGATPAAAP